MIITCPYCHNQTDEPAPPPLLRPRKMRVYHAVVQSGTDGITPEDLLVRMYADDEMPTPGGPQVLRVMISEMNKVLWQKPWRQRISARNGNENLGRYYLFSVQQEQKYEEVQPETDPQGSHSDP